MTARPALSTVTGRTRQSHVISETRRTIRSLLLERLALGDTDGASAAALAFAQCGFRWRDDADDLPRRRVCLIGSLEWLELDDAAIARAAATEDILWIPVPRSPAVLTLVDAVGPASPVPDGALVWDTALEARMHPAERASDPAKWDLTHRAVAKRAETIARAIDLLMESFAPDTLVYLHGYETTSALLRRAGIEHGLRTVAIERTMHRDRLVWDDVSGVAVNRTLARNFWWRYEETAVGTPTSPRVRELGASKQREHTAGLRTDRPFSEPFVLYLAQVYTDASMLFGLPEAWPHPAAMLRHAAEAAQIAGVPLVVKLHPKEALPTGEFSGMTRERIARDPDLAALLAQSWIIVDDSNAWSTDALIRHARAVITGNSQAGLEAALVGHRPITMAPSLYDGIGLSTSVERPLLLHAALCDALASGPSTSVATRADAFLSMYLDRFCIAREAEAIVSMAMGTERSAARREPVDGPVRRLSHVSHIAGPPTPGPSKDFRLDSGERQIAPRFEEIRPDHAARYIHAAAQLVIALPPQAARVIDLFCGNGYGSRLLAGRLGLQVDGVDGSEPAIAQAREHYAHPQATYAHAVFPFTLPPRAYDAAVCFESIEHVPDAAGLLRELASAIVDDGLLLVSTPNESVLPHARHAAFFRHHVRHFTKAELDAIADDAGFTWVASQGQDCYAVDAVGRLTLLPPQAQVDLSVPPDRAQFVITTYRRRPR